jgi:hypothetical protein
LLFFLNPFYDPLWVLTQAPSLPRLGWLGLLLSLFFLSSFALLGALSNEALPVSLHLCFYYDF